MGVSGGCGEGGGGGGVLVSSAVALSGSLQLSSLLSLLTWGMAWVRGRRVRVRGRRRRRNGVSMFGGVWGVYFWWEWAV